MTRLLPLAALAIATALHGAAAQTPSEEMQRRLAENEARIAAAQAAMNAQLGAIAAQHAPFDPATGPGYPELDYASTPLPPAVSFESALEEIRIDPTNGRFDITDFVVAFAPKRDVTGAPVAYPTQVRGRAVLKDAAGTVVLERYYNAGADGNPTTNRFEVSAHQVNNRPVARTAANMLLLTRPGAYTAEFYLDRRLITRVPFRVETVASDDPYSAAPTRYVLEGAWQDVGYLSFGDGTNMRQQDEFVRWTWWTQLDTPGVTTTRYDARFEIRRDGRLIGRTIGSATEHESRDKITATFEKTDGSGGGTRDALLRRDDLTDGDYEVRVVATNNSRGPDFTRTARFSVRGGKPVPQGAQVREGTAPEDFVEGLDRFWFYPFSTTAR